MRVFAGYGAAHRGWMHTDFLGHFLDHHRLERVGSLVQKFPLPRDDGLADAQDGVLALLDVFHQLHGGGETLFDIVAHITVGSILDQQAAVGGAQAQLRHVIFVEVCLPLAVDLAEIDVRFDQPRFRLVVA